MNDHTNRLPSAIKNNNSSKQGTLNVAGKENRKYGCINDNSADEFEDMISEIEQQEKNKNRMKNPPSNNNLQNEELSIDFWNSTHILIL